MTALARRLWVLVVHPTVITILALACGAGVFVGLLVWNRWAFLAALALGASHWLTWRLARLGPVAELEEARGVVTALSDRSTRTALDEQGPVTELGAGVRYLEGAMYNAAGVSDPTPDEVARVHTWATRMAGWLARANVRIVGPGRRPPSRPFDHALPAAQPVARPAGPVGMWDPTARRID